MAIKVAWNDFHEAWDIDSGPPQWIHTSAQTREAAISKARRLNKTGETILVKGPRMNNFKPA